MQRILALAVAGCCLAASAFADDAPPGSGDARYSFNKAVGGFLRLDGKTGEVSLCSERAVGWTCQVVPDDRAVLENEIARLRADNAILKRELISRGLRLPPGVVSESPAVSENDLTIHLPSDAEVNRFAAYLGRVWHRLVEAIAQAQKQVLNKS